MHGRQAHELPAFGRRLARQADATRAIRVGLYARLGLQGARAVVDVGCGNGAVTKDLDDNVGGHVWGLDLDPVLLGKGQALRPGRALRGDGHRLPFPDGCLDAAFCHLTLMWARDPQALVRELARVVRPGGLVVAAMEPDYGGKVHWPENPLVDLVFQGDGVRRRGGDPHAGRKLRQWFTGAGLRADVGLLNPHLPTIEEDAALMRRNRRYYRRLLHEAGFAKARIDAWEAECHDALDAGVMTSYLPLFHAVARRPVPGDVDRP